MGLQSLMPMFYGRGLQTLLSEGHINYYITVRGSDILRYVFVSGHVTLYQSNTSQTYHFSFIDNMASRTGWNDFVGRSLKTLFYDNASLYICSSSVIFLFGHIKSYFLKNKVMLSRFTIVLWTMSLNQTRKYKIKNMVSESQSVNIRHRWMQKRSKNTTTKFWYLLLLAF